MNNKQIRSFVMQFRQSRAGWIDILTKNGDSVKAAQQILSINSKIELLLSLWDWADESVEYPV